MRVLVIGGCGLVGSIVVPHLAKRHDVVVLDIKDPVAPTDNVTYHRGNVREFDRVRELAAEADALVFMAMGPLAGWGTPATAEKHFDVAVTGLYLALEAAHEAGVRQAVYTSSMSVLRLRDPESNVVLKNAVSADESGLARWPDESVPTDSRDFYGFAKRLGEQVAENAALNHGMDVTCLRLCFPAADDEWPRRDTRIHELISTSARDVAGAIDAALRYQGHGFDAFSISGDADNKVMDMTKAREKLGWEPLDRTS